VIGVSYYEHLPQNAGDPSPTDPNRKVFGLGQLKTPATSALRFAEWLRDVYNMPDAPKSSIRLLLSPSDVERKALGFGSLGASVLPATRDNVEAALEEWHSACRTDDDNVAILYASGHGIELTKDEGGIVLLEDVSQSIGSPLRGSLDVGRVRNGMAGHPMAQRQFYFVDACRVQSSELRDFDTQGAGIGLDSPRSGAARCTPVYFSAAPSSEAFGKLNKGTIFVQALIECLERLAVDREGEGDWYCSTTRLIPSLERRVREIASELEVEQTAVPGGTPSHAVMHVLLEPPKVPLRIRVDPENAASCCRGLLSQADGGPFGNGDWQQFAPEFVTEVPAGTYRVSVAIDPKDPRYKDIRDWPAAAKPPDPEPVVIAVSA
jgi:hypothetical protein